MTDILLTDKQILKIAGKNPSKNLLNLANQYTIELISNPSKEEHSRGR